MGDKDNIIYNDMNESIGYYKDIKELYRHLIKNAILDGDREEEMVLREQLTEVAQHKNYNGLLVLSENNGMGFTCKPYKEWVRDE